MGMLQTTLAALAEPNRFRIVELLRAGPRAVGEITDGLSLYQVQVSKHLRVLKEAGLVDVHPRAQQRVYALRPAPLLELHEWLERYRQLWDARFREMDELLAELSQAAAQPSQPIQATPRPPKLTKLTRNEREKKETTHARKKRKPD